MVDNPGGDMTCEVPGGRHNGLQRVGDGWQIVVMVRALCVTAANLP